LKFQSVFIIFNILLLIFLVIIFLTPVLFLKGLDAGAFSQNSAIINIFLRSNWVLMIILASIMAGFDVFYLYNRRLYALLEKEDWPALVNYLEDRIMQKGKYSPRLVRLLANTYLVLSDSPAVMSLENKAAMAKPSLVDDNALIFGTARILGRDIAGAVRFFESRLYSVKPGLRLWVQWYYGFCLLLNRQYEKASEEFSRLAGLSNDGIITGLSAYFLSIIIMKSLPGQKDFTEAAAIKGRERTLNSLPTQKKWIREIGKISAEIHIAVLSQYINEAGQWLYKESE
jgi:tetratricopeptide (TPR) repeat protein